MTYDSAVVKYINPLNKKERQYCAESVREIIAAWKKHQRGGD